MKRKTKAASKQRLALTTAVAVAFAQTSLHAEPMTRAFSKDGVHVEIAVDPATVELARDTEVTIAASGPEHISVRLQDNIADRFEGFSLAGSYEAPAAQTGGASGGIRHYRLTPKPGAPQYRIRPIAVLTTDTSTFPHSNGWFNTEIVDIPSATPGEAKSTVSTELEPVHIRPSLRAVPQVIGAIVLFALAVLLLAKLVAQISLHRKIRLMAPRERALLELDRLMARKLPEKGLFKDFYVELTMVVRRYIERRYGIRAPKQTTEEFLEAAASRPEFGSAQLANMRQFLSAADLVKFAGVNATVSTAAEAADKARGYLVSEPAQAQGVHETKKGGRA